MVAAKSVAEGRVAVRERYGRVALGSSSDSGKKDVRAGRRRGSGLGCGDPLALAKLRAAEYVLDLGSGSGYDCLGAAIEVGVNGYVVGIDVTPEMVSRSCQNAAEAGVPIVSFLLGDVQQMPFREATFDVVVSNCVINLCPDKTKTFAECYRVLRRGGRLAVTDILAITPVPARLAEDLALHTGCIAGVATISELHSTLSQAGFTGIRIGPQKESSNLIALWAPGLGLERWVVGADIVATK